MQGYREQGQFSSDETADAVLVAGQSATSERSSTTDSHLEPGTRAVIAVTLAGVAAFFNLYATQPLLPLFEQIFHASKSEVGRTVSAATLGVALSAPFCGSLAERIGRDASRVFYSYVPDSPGAP